MFSVVATMAILAAPALVAATGKAIVVNQCSYDVYVANTPAQFGGYSEIDTTLSTGGTYEQTWTELSNLAGWSIKLSQSATEWSSNIMQYEYTYQNDGIIWYDLSDVNGNPWDGNWEITAESPSSTCSPLQQAYRYATDDAYGMQACADDSVITVTLCSGDEAAGSSAVSSAAPVSTSAAAVSSTPVQTTTFATSTVATVSAVTTNSVGSTTTHVATSTVTSVVTSTHWHHSHYARHATKRHAHE